MSMEMPGGWDLNSGNILLSHILCVEHIITFGAIVSARLKFEKYLRNLARMTEYREGID